MAECSCPYPNPRWGDTNPSCTVHGNCFESARAEMADLVRDKDRLLDENTRLSSDFIDRYLALTKDSERQNRALDSIAASPHVWP